jgi:short-chain fatty acids transporter
VPRLPLLVRLGLAARRGFGRFTPDPFVVAIAMTLIALVAGAIAEGGGADAVPRVVRTWSASSGLWSLLAFAGQMSLMLTFGTALAAAPPVRRGLHALARLAPGPRRLVGLVALVSGTLCLFNWSLGLVCGAMFARTAGEEARRRGFALHYPLVCAAGYSGMMVWHGGLSGTAPLKVTTLSDLTEVLGPDLAARVGPIGLGDSLLGGLNLAVTGGLWLLAPLVFMALTPAQGADPDPHPAPRGDDALKSLETGPEAHVSGDTPQTDTASSALDRLERSPLVVWALALPAAAALAFVVADSGGDALDLNAINLGLWVLALVLHGRPDAFLRACDAGARACAGILLLFPLYGGIMGVIKATGLAVALTDLFAAAGPRVFTTFTFIAAGFLNLFVPSGGGQWAMQGPIVMAAALDQGVEPIHAVMAIAYGDQWTNMLQPFWAVPLLALTGVRARDIIGYCTLWMLAGGLWIAGCLLLASL